MNIVIANKGILKFRNRKTQTRCEICPKSGTETPKRHH